MVKDLDAPYDAGRRGSSWVKVKPVHTLDLVVLAVEWGSGRRQGWLSNIHLGARDARRGRVRDARQDVQGHDRRDAHLADRALHRAGHRPGRRLGVRRPGPPRAGRRDRVRRPPAVDAATPAASRCGSPASSATATTRPPPRRTRSRRCVSLARSLSSVTVVQLGVAHHLRWSHDHSRSRGPDGPPLAPPRPGAGPARRRSSPRPGRSSTSTASATRRSRTSPRRSASTGRSSTGTSPARRSCSR